MASKPKKKTMASAVSGTKSMSNNSKNAHAGAKYNANKGQSNRARKVDSTAAKSRTMTQAQLDADLKKKLAGYKRSGSTGLSTDQDLQRRIARLKREQAAAAKKKTARKK